MRFNFVKMHGLGNDFVIFETEAGQPVPDSETLSKLANRRTGIGFDQALILEPPRQDGSDIYYRVINADGDEVEQCGNGARCIASLLAGRRKSGSGELVMDSPGGLVRAKIGENGVVSLNMGVPDFAPASLPFNTSGEAYLYPLEVAGSEVEIGAVSIGNPHAVVTVASVDTAPVDRLGPARETNPDFPQRTNVVFMEIKTTVTYACGYTSAALEKPGPAAPARARRLQSAEGMENWKNPSR